jgi:quinol monooxygenase YgiN
LEHITVTALLKAIPGKEKELLKELGKVAKSSRDENGCLQYIIHESIDNRVVFVLYEKWEDEEAVQKHIESAHYQQYRGNSNITSLIENRKVFKLKTIF